MLPIIGMSPGNSYFKDKEVAYLLKETIKRYGKAVILVADIPAISTYLAMGYNLSKARTKAVLKGNNLKNKTRKVIQDMGIQDEKIILLDWDNEIKNNPHYIRQFESTKKLYYENKLFQKAVYETSKSVLINAGKDVDENNVECATHYLLSEIAFLEYAPDFFGVEKVCYVYHKNWFVFEDYISGKYDGKTKIYLDFVLLEAPFETYLPISGNYKNRFELIQTRGTIKCTFVPYFDYFNINKNGEYTGSFYEIMNKVAIQNNLKLDFVEQSGYGVVSERLNLGYADIFCSPIRPTKKRKLEMFFSKSLFKSNIFAYINSDCFYADQDIENLKQNQKIRIAVKENDIHHEIMQEYFPNARIVRVPQLSGAEEVIKFVLEDKADMTFWEDSLVEKYLKENSISQDKLNKKGRGNRPIEIYDNCFAVPWGEFELKKMIDDAIEK